MSAVVACHQPNFLPWLGYFAKIARADVFVLLDDVQFTQGHNRHNWTSRVRIMSGNGVLWLSVPVQRSGEGRQLVADLRSDVRDKRWLPKMLKTLTESYGRAPFFPALSPAIIEILQAHDGSICSTNIALIEYLVSLLGLKTRIVRSSGQGVKSASTQRLVDLTLAEGGAVYLSGDGAADYQQEQCFTAAGIGIQKLGFVHPRYPQRPGRDFVPGLSIVDALFSIGVKETAKLVLPQREELYDT